jgi:beta-glucosidase
MSGFDSDSYERPLALSDNEKAMIDLAKAHSTKVIIMLNCNNPVEIEDLKNDAEVDAIVWAGEPGVYGFLGVADVLSGAANPSGRLPDTYAVNSASAPAMQNFGLYMYTNNSNSGSASGDVAQLTTDNKGDWYVVETEGIYQGYKYYETRYEDQILGQGNAAAAEGSSVDGAWSYANEVSYPFGYGSSYSLEHDNSDHVDRRLPYNGRYIMLPPDCSLRVQDDSGACICKEREQVCRVLQKSSSGSRTGHNGCSYRDLLLHRSDNTLFRS